MGGDTSWTFSTSTLLRIFNNKLKKIVLIQTIQFLRGPESMIWHQDHSYRAGESEFIAKQLYFEAISILKNGRHLGSLSG